MSLYFLIDLLVGFGLRVPPETGAQILNVLIIYLYKFLFMNRPILEFFFEILKFFSVFNFFQIIGSQIVLTKESI